MACCAEVGLGCTQLKGLGFSGVPLRDQHKRHYRVEAGKLACWYLPKPSNKGNSSGTDVANLLASTKSVLQGFNIGASINRVLA